MMKHTIATLKEFALICIRSLSGPIKAILIFLGSLTMLCLFAWFTGFLFTDHKDITPVDIIKALETGITIIAIVFCAGIALYVTLFVLPDVAMEKWREARNKVAERRVSGND